MRAHNNPGAWWGYHGWSDRPQPMSITEIIATGSMTADVAALLWLLLEGGSSIIVSSLPRLAGKTTTLTALLDFLPERTWAYYSCGQTETFDVPPLEEGAATYLMINELSNHLPVYTWGTAALRAFDLLGQGYSLAATMHAENAAHTLAILERELGVPPPLLARVDVVLSLRARSDGRTIDRHVSELALAGADGSDGYRIDVLGTRGPDDPAFALRDDAGEAVARRLGRDVAAVERERAERRALLAELASGNGGDPEAVEAAIQQFAVRRRVSRRRV